MTVLNESSLARFLLLMHRTSPSPSLLHVFYCVYLFFIASFEFGAQLWRELGARARAAFAETPPPPPALASRDEREAARYPTMRNFSNRLGGDDLLSDGKRSAGQVEASFVRQKRIKAEHAVNARKKKVDDQEAASLRGGYDIMQVMLMMREDGERKDREERAEKEERRRAEREERDERRRQEKEEAEQRIQEVDVGTAHVERHPRGITRQIET